MGISGKEVLHTVVFLVAASEFVLLDEALVVVINVGGEYNAILGVAVHCLGIEIIARLGVLHQPTFFDEMGELSLCFGIDTSVVFVSASWKIDFGTNDVVERFFITTTFFTRFYRIEHIIGTTADLGGEMCGGTKSTEGFYSRHNGKNLRVKWVMLCCCLLLWEQWAKDVLRGRKGVCNSSSGTGMRNLFIDCCAPSKGAKSVTTKTEKRMVYEIRR